MFHNQNFATHNNGPESGLPSPIFGDSKTTQTRVNSHYNNGKASFARADTLWRSGHKVEALQEFQTIFDNTCQKDIPQYVCALLFDDDSKSCNFSDLMFWCSSAAYAGIGNDLILKILIKHVGQQLENISGDLDGYRKFLHGNLADISNDVSDMRRDVQLMTQRRKSRKKFARRKEKKRNETENKLSYAGDLRNFHRSHYLSIANVLCNDIVQRDLLCNFGYYNGESLSAGRADNSYEAKGKCKILKVAKRMCKAKLNKKRSKTTLRLRLKNMFSNRQFDILNMQCFSLKKVSMNLHKLIFLRDNVESSLKFVVRCELSGISSPVEYCDNKSDLEVAIDNFCTGNEDILRRLLSRSNIDKTILVRKSLEEFCKDHDVVLKRLVDLSTEFLDSDLASENSISQQPVRQFSKMIPNRDMQLAVEKDINKHSNITALTDITNKLGTIEELNYVIPYRKMEIKLSINNITSDNVVISNENSTARICNDEIDSFTSSKMFCNDSIEMTEFCKLETSSNLKVGHEIDYMELLIERACMFDATSNFDIVNGLDVLDSIFGTMPFDGGISELPFYEYCEDETSDSREYNSSSQEETLSLMNCYSVITIGASNDVDKGSSSEDTALSTMGSLVDKTRLATLKSTDCPSSSLSLVGDKNIWFNYVASVAKKYNIKNYLLRYSKHKNDVSVKFNINLGSSFRSFASIMVNCNLGEDFVNAMLALYPVELRSCDTCSTIPVYSSSRFLNWKEDLSVMSRSFDSMSCVEDIISRWPVFQNRLLASKYMCLFLCNIRLHNCKLYNCRLPRRDSELFLRNFIIVNAPFLSNPFFERHRSGL